MFLAPLKFQPKSQCWPSGKKAEGMDLSPSKASGKRVGDGEVSVAKVWARVGAGR